MLNPFLPNDANTMCLSLLSESILLPRGAVCTPSMRLCGPGMLESGRSCETKSSADLTHNSLSFKGRAAFAVQHRLVLDGSSSKVRQNFLEGTVWEVFENHGGSLDFKPCGNGFGQVVGHA